MPRSSENLIRLCTRAMVKADLVQSNADTSNDWQIDRLIDQYSWRAADIMGRPIEKKSRSEYFDVAPGQKDFQVQAYPIDTSQIVTVVNNNDTPRSWSDSDDEIGSDYIICNPKDAEYGWITVDYPLLSGRNALKIAYTGGLAAFTGEDGIDGKCEASGVFTSSGSLFSTRGVTSGYKLVIEDGDNAGTYVIDTVDSETQLTMTTTFFTTGTTGERFYITDVDDECLIKDYSEIAEAIMYQVAFMMRNRGRFGISNESYGGASISYERPVNWLHDVLAVLYSYKARFEF